MKQKFIINFTPTGLIPTKEMTPSVPLIPEEVVEQVLEVSELGVNMVHLHAREPETGVPSYRKEIYAEIIRGIRSKNRALVISVSTSGRNFFEFEKRAEVLDLKGELKPDLGSLTLSSLNFNKQASVNSPQMIQDLAKKMMENNIRPELEVFDLGMINYAKYLIRKGFIKPPYYFNLILGNIACAQANMLSLGLMVNELPEGTIWSAGGVGERTRLASNRDLVERVLTIAEAMGREPYSQQETRELLGV
ncbi:MAG: 3-keto-5-aminohexanoate cleavage protein [Deltaproteobacteria bacterium]|nr:3-keto-5-aminohexanoate cleavage protein [Deltaproteobacteria bacterium]